MGLGTRLGGGGGGSWDAIYKVGVADPLNFLWGGGGGGGGGGCWDELVAKSQQ